MNYLKFNEKLLKHHLKNKKRITLSLIVTFLITGGLGFVEEEALARDLRPRNEKNNIKFDESSGIKKGHAANNKDVINIVAPEKNGISHNKFIEFNVGEEGVIFNNNSTKPYVDTKLGGIVEKNTNLNGKEATAILNEVSGKNKSYLDGPVEIAGQKADFILANENGITVNGGGFINTSGVTLTTGKVNNENLNIDVTKGHINIEGEGVNTSGSYFNIISQTIEVSGQISSREGQNDADLNFIAGNNKVDLSNKNKPEVKGQTNGEKATKNFGIYAGPLGAMYGNNIRLISTTEGLGVRHEGLIRSKGDITIDAKGDISIGGLNSEKNIEVKGVGKLETIDGTYKVDGKTYNYSITSTKGVKLNVTGNMEISNFISANGTEGLEIKAQNLKILGDKKTTAGILAQGELLINVTGDITLETLMRPVRKGHSSDDPPLVLTTDKEGKITVTDPMTNEVLTENDYSWVGTGIQGERVNISSNTFTNNSSITNTRYLIDKSSITIDAKEKLTNNNLIYSSGTLDLKSKVLDNKEGASLQGSDIKIIGETINNNGEIRQNIAKQGESANRLGEVKVNFKNGTFTNTGTISGYAVEIEGQGFNLVNSKEGKIVASTVDYPLGQGSIYIKVKDLKTEGLIQSYGAGTENNIKIDVETLSNTLGHIVAQKGDVEITSTGNIVNTGKIFADKNVTIKSNSKSNEISNNGGDSSIGAGENVTITGENTKLTNSGKIYATQKLLVMVNEVINAGTAEGLNKYLQAFYNLGQDGTKEIDKILEELKNEIKTASGEQKTELEKKVELFTKLKDELKDFNTSLETLPNIGSMSATTIDITSNKTTQNNGIVKATQDIKVTSKGALNNTGILEAGKEINLKADEAINNTQRIYAGEKIDITGKTFASTGSQELQKEYSKALEEFTKLGGNSKLEELQNKVTELETKLKASNSKDVDILNKELKENIDKIKELAQLKAKISTLVEKKESGKEGDGLSTIESKNINITTTGGSLKNAGLIVTDENLNLKASGENSDISNTGNISVGKDANVSGNSFVNEIMTVGNKLVAKVQKAFDSKDLKVAKDIEVEAQNAKFNKLNVGGNGQIKLVGNDRENVTFGNDEDKDSAVNVTGNLTIDGGGLVNKTNTVIKGSLAVDKKDNNKAKFDNTGSLAVKENTTIKTNSFDNKKSIVAEKGLNVESSIFNNSKDGKINTTDLSLKATDNITNEGNIEAKGNVNISGEKTLTNSGKLLVQGSGKLDIKDSVTNSGELKVGKNSKETRTAKEGELKSGELVVNTGTFTNEMSGKVSGEEALTIKVAKGFDNKGNGDKNNPQGGEITGGSILIDGKAETLDKNFENSGTIASEKTLTVDLGTNDKDINLGKSGKMSSKDTMTLVTGGNISNEGKFSNLGGLDFSAGKAITNKGMIVSKGDIKLKAKETVTNGEKEGTGATIWSEGKIDITSENGDINNYQNSTIQSKDDMSLTATNGTLLNEGGTISAGGKLDINVKKLENKSIVDINQVELEYGAGKHAFLNLQVTKDNSTWVEIWLPKIKGGNAVKAQSTIEAGKDINIAIKEKLHNQSAKIRGANDINIKGSGEVINETLEQQIPIDRYLKYTKIKVEDTYRNGLDKAKVEKIYEGNLYDGIDKKNGAKRNILAYNPVLMALRKIKIEDSTNKEWSSLEMQEFYNFLDKATNNALTNKNGIKNTSELVKELKRDIYSSETAAEILAGKNINIDGKIKFENIGSGSKKEGNQKITVDINGKPVDTVDTDLGVIVTDPNSVTEANGIKYPEGVEVIKGSVTIDGKVIDASTGGTVSSIAVAGTINPISYIEIPKGDNGIFKLAAPRPGKNIQYKFETNIDFIDPSKYFGSEYFFNKIGYNSNKTSTVIGDAYYEQQLINKTIKNALGYTGEITSDNIKDMLDSAVNVEKNLGLEVGKALTPEQINKLEKDIVWYVEVDMGGEKVLVPQVYFGKETRLKMAEEDKGGGIGSTLKAGGNIDIKGDSVTNINGNIVAKENVNINVTGDVINNAAGGFSGGISSGENTDIKADGKLDMIGGTISSDGSVKVDTKGNINIESTLGGVQKNQNVSNEAGISAKGDIIVNSQEDVTIKNGNIASTDGDLNLSAKNIKIEDQNLINTSENYGTADRGITKTESKSISSTSDGSELSGKNITINSKEDTNVTGSSIAAEKELNIIAGKDVNIKDGTNNYYETSKSTTNGFDSNYKLNIGSSSSTTEATISKGSTIGGVTGLNIKSNNDVNIQGSTVVGGENGIKIAAEKNINLTDGKNEIKNKSHSETYDVISYQRRDSQSETNKSIGNKIISTGNVEISSNENITSIGTNIAAGGNTNITAKNNADFKAGKNTHNEKNSSIGVGIVSGGVSLGAGGYSVESSWTPTDGTDSKVVGGKASDQTIDDMTKTGKLGKNYMDSLAKLGTEMGISIKNESKKSTTWTEGDIKSNGDINIKTGGTTDIGGVNLESDKTINIQAKQVDTTKYVDEHEEKSSNIGVTVRLDNMTTSAVADAVNKGMQISEGAKGHDGGLNPALTAAQAGGTAANLVFGDLIANTTALTGNISYGQSESKTTEENTTNIKAKDNVNITATNGDINLKGVEIEADKEVALNTTGNINLEAAKKTEKEKSFGVNASAGVTTTGGVSTLSGANTQLGIAGNGSYSETSKNNVYYKGSSIKSGGKTTINSGKDTNLIGSTIAGETVDIKTDGNLNIETKKDKINEHRKEGWGGLDVSAGLATNTIFTGSLGVSAGGGDIWKNGDKINEQAGITAKKDINAEIKGDANIKGGILGSETGEGNLKVAGDLNISDIHSNYEEGGAIVGVNGGTEGGGILGEVGDRVDLEKTANGTIAINKENIKVDKDIIVNNNKVDIGDINSDSNKALTTDKDEKENGGTFSATASALPIKKKQKGSYDIDNDYPPPPIRREPPTKEVTYPPGIDKSEPDGRVRIPVNKEEKFVEGVIENGPEIKRAIKVSQVEEDKFIKGVIKGGPEIKHAIKVTQEEEAKFVKGVIKDGPEVKQAIKKTQDPEPIKGVLVKEGYIKTEEGKWVKLNGERGEQGVVTTEGPFTPKGLKGFREGVEDGFVKGVIKDGPGVKQAVKKTQGVEEDNFVKGEIKDGPEVKQAIKKTQDPEPTKGVLVKEGYIKTEEGKWIKLNGERGEQGVVTTEGPFTPKGLKGFKAGVKNGDDFVKGVIKDGPGVKQAVKKTQGVEEDNFAKGEIKDGPGAKQAVKKTQGVEEDNFAKGEVKDGPEVKQAIKKTQDPEPTKGVLVKEGYIKTEEGKWVKLNGERGEQGVVTTEGPFTPKGLKGFKAGVKNGDDFVKGVIKDGPGVKQAIKKRQGAEEESFVKGEIKDGPGAKQAVKKTQGVEEESFVKGEIKDGPGAKQAIKKTQGVEEESFVKGEIKDGPGAKQAVKKTQEKENLDIVGGYKKGTDGKWYPNRISGEQGAALTGGLSYKGVKGFQKGVKDLTDKSKVIESPNVNHVRDENGTFHKVKFVPTNDGTTYVKAEKGTYHRVEKAENSDKYSLLDKDNAFDLPKDDGVRATFKDTAGETPIKKEHYEPLYGEPSQDVLNKNKKDKLPPLPPVDYVQAGEKDKLPSLPPVDYVQAGGKDKLPPLPPVDYVQTGGKDKLPPLPPIDYNQGGIKNKNNKKVNFSEENPEVSYVPKEDSTRKPYDNNRDSDDISEDIEGLIKEQNSFTEKLNSGKKLSKSERERIKEIEKEMRQLKDELNDAIGRDKADRPDSERIPDELSSLFREQQKLADKLNKGQKLQKEERNRLEEIENELRTLINTIHNGNTGNGERLAPPAAAPVTKVVNRVPSISDNRIESPKVTLDGKKIKPPVPPKPSKNKNVTKSEEEITYADLKDLGNGSGVIIGKGNETIYSEVKTSGKDNPPPLPPKKMIGKKVKEEKPVPPKREESLVVDTAKKIDDLMKEQQELVSKKQLSKGDKKKLEQIEKELLKQMAQLQKDFGDKGPDVPLRNKSLN